MNGSIAPITGFPSGAGFYAASKGGIHAMSRSMAAELAPRGIRINVVAPGFIQTPGWERGPVSADVMTALTKRLLGSVPLDRWGQAEEVAKVVLFLASDDSSYVHGCSNMHLNPILMQDALIRLRKDICSRAEIEYCSDAPTPRCVGAGRR